MAASDATDLYWTLAQLVAHHTCGGCNLVPGDLFGTGTISGSTIEGYGSLMELSADGTRPTILASGETRTFLEDGDEVIFRGHCRCQASRRSALANAGRGSSHEQSLADRQPGRLPLREPIFQAPRPVATPTQQPNRLK